MLMMKVISNRLAPPFSFRRLLFCYCENLLLGVLGLNSFYGKNKFAGALFLKVWALLPF